MTILPYLVAVWLLLVGLYGMANSPNIICTILSLTVVQAASYVLLLAVGYRNGQKAPIFADIPPHTAVVDPVVQVLVLVDVVVGATITALLLALAVQGHKRFGTLDVDRLRALRG